MLMNYVNAKLSGSGIISQGRNPEISYLIYMKYKPGAKRTHLQLANANCVRIRLNE